jgi:hypothetical protein
MVHLQWFAGDHPYLLYPTVAYDPTLLPLLPLSFENKLESVIFVLSPDILLNA